jgi:DNA-binding HxlR family transcriptional regulator
VRCRRCEQVPEEVRRAANLLERRWTVTVLWAAHEGAVRFNEFRYACGRIPPRTLAERLADLEEAGVLERVVIDSRPPRVEYRLTERGRALRTLVDALARWAEPRGVRPPKETPAARR